MDTRRLAPYAPLLLALLTAAILQAVHVARSPTISADGITFIAIARGLPDGVAESFQRHDQHPGYPAMLLAAAHVVHWLGYRADPESWAVGGIVVSYLAGLGSVGMVWLLARNLFDTRAANIAAFIFAVLPVPIWNAGDAHSDMPHLFAYLTAAWLASSAVTSGRLLPLAGAGAVSALAYWIRPEGLEVFLVALACLVWQTFRAGWTWRQAGLACAALSGTTLVVAAPYPILSGKLTSKQLPFMKNQPVETFIHSVAATQTPPQAPAQPVEDNGPPPVVAAAFSSPAVAAPKQPVEKRTRYSASLVLRLLGKGVSAFLNSICQGFKFVFIPFYLIGHVECVRRKPEWLQVGMLALLGATHFVVLLGVYILSGYIAHRHVLPMIALAMPFTALGVICVSEAAARRWKVQPARVVPMVLGLCCAGVLPYTVRAVNREFIPVIAATHWVEDHAPPGSGIICNSPYVAFYGTLPVTYLNYEAPSLDDALAKAETDARYDYVVLHVNAHDYRPEWIAQLETRYRQVQLFPDPSSVDGPKKVLVFQAKDAHVSRPGAHGPS